LRKMSMIDGYSDWDAERKREWENARGNTVMQASMALNNPGMKQFVLCLVNGQGSVELLMSADPMFLLKTGAHLTRMGETALNNLEGAPVEDDDCV